MLKADLHTHTTASDGELTPMQLYQLQRDSGNALFAITDHDTLAGWDELQAAVEPGSPTVISGIELSCCWDKLEIHVVGLNFDAEDPDLRALVAAQAQRRVDRAHRISQKFTWLGIPGSFEAAQRVAGDGIPGRPHFARFLVESGRLKTVDEAFRRYLADGKPAACRTEWPQLEEVVERISAAGGVSVLAHPMAYGYTWTKLRRLLERFCASGGHAVEVAVPGVNPDHARHIARLTHEYGLRGSAGSDFHVPGQAWRHPSRVPAMPEQIEPIWANWV